MIKKVFSIFKKIFRTLFDSEFRLSVKADYVDAKAFYLDDQQKERLKEVGFIKRFFLSTWWLLKSLYEKLTPIRKILLILSLFFLFANTFLFSSNNVQIPNNTFIGAVIILFILMLELKDKLLAKDELNEGKAVQQALLPDSNPQIEGWDIWFISNPANEVGGDLVDYLKISAERFALMLADISGKGLGAALLMAKLQSIIRTLAPDFSSLSGLLNKVNKVFYRDSLKKSFASMIYLELHPQSSVIKFINAGHLPPIYISGSSLVEMPKGAQAIGLSANVSYKEEMIKLNSGDYLFVYSDGLTEAVNTKGEFFDQKLTEILPALSPMSARECGEEIVEAVEDFIGTAKMHDDLSLLVLKKI